MIFCITDLFLIIHNIDGMTLRNDFAQNLLSRFSELPKLHIVSSIDHINAPLSEFVGGSRLVGGGVLHDYFREMGARRNSTETQQSGHAPRSGSEI